MVTYWYYHRLYSVLYHLFNHSHCNDLFITNFTSCLTLCFFFLFLPEKRKMRDLCCLVTPLLPEKVKPLVSYLDPGKPSLSQGRVDSLELAPQGKECQDSQQRGSNRSSVVPGILQTPVNSILHLRNKVFLLSVKQINVFNFK